jgi:hypothetical protein
MISVVSLMSRPPGTVIFLNQVSHRCWKKDAKTFLSMRGIRAYIVLWGKFRALWGISLKIIMVSAALVVFFLPQTGHAAEKARVETGVSTASRTSPADQATRSADMAKEAREKAEVLERARDRRMREISRGICTGC